LKARWTFDTDFDLEITLHLATTWIPGFVIVVATLAGLDSGNGGVGD
jgi:hypothetical protein